MLSQNTPFVAKHTAHFTKDASQGCDELGQRQLKSDLVGYATIFARSAGAGILSSNCRPWNLSNFIANHPPAKHTQTERNVT
jgi:hypothetical protein